VCRVDFWGLAGRGEGSEAGVMVLGRGEGEALRWAEKRRCIVFSVGTCQKATQGECVIGSWESNGIDVRCTATSSGRLSLNRFRVLLPISLPSTRVTGSPQLLFPKSKLKREVVADVDVMLSRSIAIPWSGKGVGERDSGVEMNPPKLEMERGESSDDRLRLKPIVDAVGGQCDARWRW
jgi:hypothetical protein